MNKRLFFVVYIFFIISIFAQEKDIRFISYQSIPTWTGMGIKWHSDPEVKLYDSGEYKGHAEFANKNFDKKLSFDEFRNLSKIGKTREYLPFFLYDLSSKPLKTKKGIYNWALRLEDYSYDDKPEVLVSEIMKLQSLIINLDPSFTPKGIIIISEDKKSSLYKNRLSKFLDKKNNPYWNLNQLLEYMNGKKQMILNEGEATGELKLVSNEKDLKLLESDDIAILSFIPLELPPVSGTISVVPQSPLSHVNLLAKSRNVVNIYINGLNSIPNLKKMIGKSIKILAYKDKITITEISKKGNKKSKRVIKPKLPEIKTDLDELISITQQNEKYITPNYIGSKASNYYNLIKLAPSITRPAYAIGFKYYQIAIKGELDNLIKSFLNKKSKFKKEEIKKSLAKIRKEIEEKGVISPEILTAISAMKKSFKENTKFRLRSSTNAEDLPEFSGAGLYESKGFFKEDSNEIISKKILSVYASLWTDRAFFEREESGIQHEKVSMAILINEAFKEEAANGVILVSLNKMYKKEILINAQIGEYSVAKQDGSNIAETIKLDSECQVKETLTESSISPIFINNSNNDVIRSEICMYSSLLFDEFYSKYDKNNDLMIDIEFKILPEKRKNKLYFKQIRPILLKKG